MSEPAPKRRKLDPPVEDGRKLWLKQLRAMCDRKSTVVVVNGVGNHSGLQLLRFFLLDVFSGLGVYKKVFKMEEMECRHQSEDFRPEGVEACMSSGTLDKGKAQGFVVSDFKKKLRQWLNARTTSFDPAADLSEDSETSGDEETEMSLPELPPSSWDPSMYPSSQTAAGGKRKSTKARLMVLTYLHHNAGTEVSFREAYKALTTSDDVLLHLCGCGLSNDQLPGCVTGSHLKLGSAELNRDHTHLHFTLRLASSGEAYSKLLEGISGSLDGIFDDVF